MSRILLGVSGGIAAYKALELVRLATGAGHVVRVLQTPASRRFVGEASFAALTGAPVLVSEFEHDPARGAFPDQQPPTHQPLSHLELVSNADVYLIAPASANTIAKLANGLADNLLSSSALAAACPVVLAPAMNNRMYEHPAMRANLKTLRERGVSIVEPGVGRLASKGEEGIGRLAEPAELLAACEAVLAGQPSPQGREHPVGAPEERWRGLRVLVTAGGTREPIDSVRFVGNSSSGRMGLALAQAARARGAEVTLVAANVALPAPTGVLRREVVTAAELKDACEEEFPSCDVLLMAAAVADFRPAAPKDAKISKADRARLELELEPTADVLAGLAESRRDGQTLIGFAAEHGERAIDCGREKLTAKGLDAVVVNDISREDIGFDVDANEVTILTAARGRSQNDRSEIGQQHVPRASKAEVAEAILDAVERLRTSN
jgi:phosphopantothenoylcysteine decarboxylase / phosphopantothenate---cysteine ligase